MAITPRRGERDGAHLVIPVGVNALCPTYPGLKGRDDPYQAGG